MPLKPLLKNKLLIQKHWHVHESSIDDWPFWMLEENIKIINELNEEEEQQRKKDEDQQQKGVPNFNPNKLMDSVPKLGNMPNFGNLGSF
jgi:hypothetical protein